MILILKIVTWNTDTGMVTDMVMGMGMDIIKNQMGMVLKKKKRMERTKNKIFLQLLTS